MTLSRVPTLSAPDWITGAELRYDILAKMPPDATPDQALRMVQALLAERFRLDFHHEQRVLPYYALVVAKDGPRMPKATSAPVTAPAGFNGQLHIPSNRMPMSGVVSVLALHARAGRGRDWAGWRIRSEACLDAGRSIFTAVQEQLGLRLVSRKGPMDVMVIDRADKIPTDN